MQSASYTIAGPHITYEAFDDEFVVLDLNTGKYFSLAGLAAWVWHAVVVAGCDPVALSASLAQKPEAQAAFASCFAALHEADLLRLDSRPAAAGTAWPGAIAAVPAEFRFEAFDDLAALLVADPVHDVESTAGWPHQPVA